ncbi:MAG: hypothetical protein SFW07_02180 [Gammaproteobacteria bacterium]|nr:hypothetical protein [Gammaproteobacteria bacterium]
MFAAASAKPTEYLTKKPKTTIKLTFIAANEQRNPEVFFEFSDKDRAIKFFKNRSDGDIAGGSEAGSFKLICTSDLSTGRLVIKDNLSPEDLLMHTRMFSIVLDCITEYEKGLTDEFFLSGLNTDKFSTAAVKENGKNPTSLILQDLAKCSGIPEIVAKDLRFEISIDVNGLDVDSIIFYTQLVALEEQKKQLITGYETKKGVTSGYLSLSKK